MEQALTDLYRAENRLRYIMGLSMSDGRLIRPSDEPTTARVAFDWSGIHCEALTRRVEVRKREMGNQAPRAGIDRRPQHDVAPARRGRSLPLVGFGRRAVRSTPAASSTVVRQSGQDSTAFDTLTSGEFQEWQLGLQLSMPIGFRRELSGVRHHELLIARERAILQDLELEISHQLGDSIRDVDN